LGPGEGLAGFELKFFENNRKRFQDRKIEKSQSRQSRQKKDEATGDALAQRRQLDRRQRRNGFVPSEASGGDFRRVAEHDLRRGTLSPARKRVE